MFVISFIAHPQTAVLQDAFVLDCYEKWSASALRWLAKGEAAEFFVKETPPDFDRVWGLCQTHKIDLAIQKVTSAHEERHKKLLLADMDSTMIEQECIDELAIVAGVGEKVSDITKRAMNGELDFDKALHARVSLLKGLPASVIDQVVRDRITLAKGGKVLLDTIKKNKAHAALVSGGFTAFTALISQELGFDEHHANVLEVKDGVLTGQVIPPILGQQAKLQSLHDISQKLAIGPSDVLAVGDGANDLAMIQAAGLGVALHAKPVVQAQSRVKINYGDLSALLYLQGYHKSEFVFE